MTERLQFRLPNVPKDVDPIKHVITLLKSGGLSRSDAQRLVDGELNVKPITGFRKLTELLEGRYSDGGESIEASSESKVTGAKVAAFIAVEWRKRQRAQSSDSRRKGVVRCAEL